MGDINLVQNSTGQSFSVQLTSATDGSDVTSGTPTVQVSKDGGAMAAIAGSIAHQANGSWLVSPTDADTDFLRGAFSISLAGAISVTINAFTGVLKSGEVANAVWDQPRSANTTAGSFGEGVASVQGNVTGSVASVTGNVDGSVASVTGNVGGSVAGTVNDVLQAVEVSTVSQISIGNQVLATDAPESYSTATGTPTLAQILHEINQTAADFSITGTTLTVRDKSGATAMTFTLDSSTDPTDRTRTT